MNKNELKSIVYIIIGIFLIGIFLKMLPFFIIAGVVVYGVFKIVNYVKEKTKNVKFKSNLKYKPNYSTSQVHVEDDLDTSKAIDVDYKNI